MTEQASDLNPIFLTVAEVLEIHEDQISRYGGSAGIRDMNLLESAVQAPTATYAGKFLNADLYAMAAALLHSLVKNHAFVDGNKRVGTASALVFLSLNDVSIRQDDDALTDLVLAVATSRATREQVAEYFRTHAA